MGHINVGGPTDCWTWTGSRTLASYGQFGFAKKGGRSTYAHRLSYELAIGCIPEGHQIHHRCKNRLCVNPAHLESISVGDHARHHSQERKSTGVLRWLQCSRGHELSGDNVVVKPDGRRRCKACIDAREAVYAEAKKMIRQADRKERVESRQVCARGHDLSGHGAIERKGKTTGNIMRICRICALDAVKRYQKTAAGKATTARAKAKSRGFTTPAAPQTA